MSNDVREIGGLLAFFAVFFVVFSTGASSFIDIAREGLARGVIIRWPRHQRLVKYVEELSNVGKK